MGWAELESDSAQQPQSPQTAQAWVLMECCSVLMEKDPGEHKQAWETHLISLPFQNESSASV